MTWKRTPRYFPPKQSRICSFCQRSFVPNGATQRWCKECVPHKEAWYFARHYNLSWPAYQALQERAKGKCEICGKVNAKVKDVFVDHSHVTGKVRGLLCSKCNIFLGALDYCPDFIQKVLQYLETSNAKDS